MGVLVGELLTEESIAEIDEADLVKRLLASSQVQRDRIIGLHGIAKDVQDFQAVPLTGVPGKITRGDIDILLCSPHIPEDAVGIEAKRVKVGTAAMRSGKPNKLSDLRKGVDQANRLAKIGFSQVYLYIFIVVDSREQNAGKYSFSGVSTEIKGNIDRTIGMEVLNLCGRVGIYQCEFTQPMDDEPLSVGAFHGYLRKKAQRVEQSQELTQWVTATTEAIRGGTV